jgi:hypothetical protein
MLWVGSGAPLRGATIFDNSANDLVTRFNPGTFEVGDEIALAGTERYLTTFSFEYWGANSLTPATFAGTITADVRFYMNDGAPFNGYATPGTKFYDSGPFSLAAPTDRSTFTFSEGADLPVGGLFIPTDDMTWSVEFTGMGLTDTVGVDIYSPPVVGSDWPDYWQNNGGWSLLTNVVPMDFAAKMDATVPEPSILVLSLVGGMGLLTLARRFRRKE